jgi:hypothetical protein
MVKVDTSGCNHCVDAVNQVIRIFRTDLEAEIEAKRHPYLSTSQESIKEMHETSELLDEIESFITLTKNKIKRECEILATRVL